MSGSATQMLVAANAEFLRSYPPFDRLEPEALAFLAEHLRLAFISAWLLCSIFYFAQYALRSAPGVMLDELGAALALGHTAGAFPPRRAK